MSSCTWESKVLFARFGIVTKVDGCGKSFTQLGNLKSHQLKVHSKPEKSTPSPVESKSIKSSEGVHKKRLKEYQLLMGMKAVIDKCK
jgi:hypothetical protein